jgi:predicted metal-dependent enzyme (double-stranded beta helix superfamily)
VPGTLDDIADYLFPARKGLKKAAGPADPTVAPGTVGMSQSDIAAQAQKDADRAKAAKMKVAPIPAKKKKISSIGDLMDGYS